ncbi:efflux RND transporter periplasmic adaptor subunit [Agromyces italicus]|uniref:efflux RND transporter periplasmic adaptor subunit n=1 Tax=Agromyces italicus TaxID=279572 RepID=UPI0003B465F9|nr:secretion protein HlyD [Agromyces italicus]
MGVWRKWIFPTVRIVVIAVIAVALTKLAFFPDRAESEAEALAPTGSVAEPQVVVERGVIANDVLLTGTVDADASVPVKAAATGPVDEVFVKVGQRVDAGQKLFDIKVEDQVDPAELADSAAPPAGGQPQAPVVSQPTFHYEKVLAPAAGVLSSLEVIPGQPVSTGDVAGQVAPPSYSVTAMLSPEQQYRLTSAPKEALVTIAGGPAPFTCTALKITTPLAGSGRGAADDAAAAPEAGSATTVRCAVPADVQVFAGLTAQVKISAGSAQDVLTVPTTAVAGGAETGVVWLIGDAGEPVERPVKLGLSDGSNVEVIEGVAEGDQVLKFVPGAGAADEEACVSTPDGAMMCGTPVE